VSSHREAPQISKDPVADNTDLYAFVSPDNPNMVTIIANYLPLEGPAGGPNFFEFGDDDVQYSIYIDNNGDGRPDITYDFTFDTDIGNPDTFLYNTGVINHISDDTWNRRQVYSIQRNNNTIATRLACPPCNIGPVSTPHYDVLAGEAVHTLPSGETVFAGQRLDGFFVDLGSIFDLADLRPLSNFHFSHMTPSNGVNTLKHLNVHSIAIQLPITMLTRDGKKPASAASRNAVIGVWAAASRPKVRVLEEEKRVDSGPWVQVSRLGNPLFNEVIVPMSRKDEWNAVDPTEDDDFAEYVLHPELANLLPGLYPGVFTNLAKLTAPRKDLVAVLLTGIKGLNYTGHTLADMLRLNVAIPPTTTNPNPLGVVAGDAAGYPNGRRVFDDVVTIELRAIAGLTYNLLVDSSYKVDGAVGLVSDGTGPNSVGGPYLNSFPYLGLPLDGFHNPSS
jgi:uncharacterized protein DUF4331